MSFKKLIHSIYIMSLTQILKTLIEPEEKR
jgi:hypothetical protein